MTVLELEHVSKRYGGDVDALRDVSLRIEEGDDLVIVGPSGSGKSTLLHIMGVLEQPTSGTVALAGQDPAQLTDSAVSRLRGRHIGFVFQQAHLISHMTALENVVIGLRYAGVPRDERRSRAREALDRVGLAARADHLPSQLSGGERQRVGIARALVCRPALLLADEPTGALDTATGQQVLVLLAELNRQGVTVALITHDEAIASTFRRRVEIRDGHLTEQVPR